MKPQDTLKAIMSECGFSVADIVTILDAPQRSVFYWLDDKNPRNMPKRELERLLLIMHVQGYDMPIITEKLAQVAIRHRKDIS